MFFSDHRIQAVSNLGQFLREFSDGSPISGGHADVAQELEAAIVRSHRNNGWFIEENQRHALAAWGQALSHQALLDWRQREGGAHEVNRTRVGIVMAGNIPLVGLHDFLAVFLSGHFALIKRSSDDEYLIPVLVKILLRHDPLFEGDWVFVDRLNDMEAVIATGSDNTARYFEYYFGKYPNIIRKNRTSIALLDGSESDEELAALGEDIFRYFGMGCRNVGHVVVPEAFDVQRIFANIVDWNGIVNNNKYGNNYEYYRALFLLNQDEFLENGFVIVRENEELHTPVGILHISRYGDEAGAAQKIAEWGEKIQCVVGHGHIPFGKAQKPDLWEYADGVNTMAFLAQL